MCHVWRNPWYERVSQHKDVSPRADGDINECFAAVSAHVKHHGGSVQHGWAFWEWPTVLVEAEFHAVWRRENGSLLDVAPRADSEQRILFLADPIRVFTGVAVDNVRLALRDDPRIAEFIKLAEKKYALLNRGERAHQFGAVAIPRDEIEPVLVRMLQLQSQLAGRLGRNDPCRCGSGRKYKKCHGSA